MSKVHTLPKAPAAAPVKTTKVVNMSFVKSTPGTHVYASDADDAVCTQVYLKKSQIGETAPKSITMTIEF